MKKLFLKMSFITILFNPTFAQDAARGKTLYSTCIQCHGDNGMGNVEKKAPKIAGQFDWYIVSSIKAFKTNTERKNPEMLPYIRNLSNTDISDLAAYISSMK